MPTERLSMRRIRELLRLKFENGLSSRLIAASAFISAMNCLKSLLSYALSARTAFALKPSSRSLAGMLSWRWPTVRMKRTGRPSVSQAMWILVVSPPLERPRA